MLDPVTLSKYPFLLLLKFGDNFTNNVNKHNKMHLTFQTHPCTIPFSYQNAKVYFLDQESTINQWHIKLANVKKLLSCMEAMYCHISGV